MSYTFGNQYDPMDPMGWNTLGSYGLPVTAGEAMPATPAVASTGGAAGGMNNVTSDMMQQWQGRNSLGKMFWNQDGTFDWGAAGTAVKALGGLGSLYLGFQQNKQAKEALNFQKQAYETNLANQIKSYNMALEDRAYARAAQYGQSAEDTKSYIDRWKL